MRHLQPNNKTPQQPGLNTQLAVLARVESIKATRLTTTVYTGQEANGLIMLKFKVGMVGGGMVEAVRTHKPHSTPHALLQRTTQIRPQAKKVRHQTPC
jgi:hypothetical protein